MLRTAPPIVARLRLWSSRADAKTLLTDRAEIEALLRAGPAEVPDNTSPIDAEQRGATGAPPL